jgi:hypothetical protein
VLKMFFGENRNRDIAKGEVNKSGIAVLMILIASVAVMGVYIPSQLAGLIKSASGIIMGGL